MFLIYRINMTFHIISLEHRDRGFVVLKCPDGEISSAIYYSEGGGGGAPKYFLALKGGGRL